MIQPAWPIRLAMLVADRNEGCESWKYAPRTIRPMTTGRAPLSPLRTRRSHTRMYSPSELASTSGALVSAMVSAASLACGSPASATAPGVSSLSGSPP